jgi:urease accessory protein
MIRARRVFPAGAWDRTKEADRVALGHEDRHRRRIAMNGEGGIDFLLDLAEATHLRDGDGLALEDGRIVRVVAAPEPVVDITGDPRLLARVAWHIGNRHVPAEIMPDRIRIARDHVLEEMIAKLGAKVTRAEAAFDPEPGAYAEHSHDDAHGHDHTHGHRHDH